MAQQNGPDQPVGLPVTDLIPVFEDQIAAFVSPQGLQLLSIQVHGLQISGQAAARLQTLDLKLPVFFLCPNCKLVALAIADRIGGCPRRTALCRQLSGRQFDFAYLQPPACTGNPSEYMIP